MTGEPPKEDLTMDSNILKAIIKDRPVSFKREFVSLGAGITGALMLSQALYWTSRTRNPNGWFYKTMQEWEDETGMTRREQETARKRLKRCGVLEEKKMGIPCKLHFRVNFEALLQILTAEDGQTGQNSMHESDSPVCTNPPNWDGGIRQTITETTAETTPESHPPCSPPTGDDTTQPNLTTLANQVFTYWTERLVKGGKVKFTADRKRKVVARLREGYDVEDLKQAVDGILKSPHHMGQNDQGIRYDDLELICRKGSKVEHFMGLADSKAARSAPKLKEL